MPWPHNRHVGDGQHVSKVNEFHAGPGGFTAAFAFSGVDGTPALPVDTLGGPFGKRSDQGVPVGNLAVQQAGIEVLPQFRHVGERPAVRDGQQIRNQQLSPEKPKIMVRTVLKMCAKHPRWCYWTATMGVKQPRPHC